MGLVTTSAARYAGLDDVRAFTYKLMPTCMLALLVAYITSTLIYTINLKQPLPSKVALSISFLFLAFLIIFVGGVLILHFSYRAARLSSLDVEKGCDPAIRADTETSMRKGSPEVQRDDSGAVPGLGPGTQDEHLDRLQRYHEQNVGIGNGMPDPREPLLNVPDDRRNQPHRDPRDSIELSLPRRVDRHYSVPRQVEPQQPIPQHIDARHLDPLSSNPVHGYGVPGGQTRPPLQPRKPSVPELIHEESQPNYNPGHDPRHTLPSIRTIPPSPLITHWPGGSDHRFGQGSGTPVSWPQNAPIDPQNRLPHAQGWPPDPQNSPLGPQGAMRPQGPRPLPARVNESRAQNPRIHLTHTDTGYDAQDVLAVLLHLFNDKEGTRLRNVLLAMDNKTQTRARHAAVAEEMDMPPEYKSETYRGKDGTVKPYDGEPDCMENKLEQTDDKSRHHEKPRSAQQEGANRSRRAGIRRKLRLLDLLGANRVFVEDPASEYDGCVGDDDLSPKTREEPDWVTLLKSWEWKPVEHSKRDGRVFGTGEVEGGDQQAAQRRPGPMVWGCEDDKKALAEDDWSDESDYDKQAEKEDQGS